MRTTIGPFPFVHYHYFFWFSVNSLSLDKCPIALKTVYYIVILSYRFEKTAHSAVSQCLNLRRFPRIRLLNLVNTIRRRKQ